MLVIELKVELVVELVDELVIELVVELVALKWIIVVADITASVGTLWSSPFRLAEDLRHFCRLHDLIQEKCPHCFQRFHCPCKITCHIALCLNTNARVSHLAYQRTSHHVCKCWDSHRSTWNADSSAINRVEISQIKHSILLSSRCSLDGQSYYSQ